MRVGYVPYSPDLSQPGDRRRFAYYAARRGLEFEHASPEEDYDLVVMTPRADLDRWAIYRPGEAKLVFDIVDSYLDIPRTNVKQMLRGPAKFVAGHARTPFFSYRASLERILRRADAVTCATPEQAATIARYCRNVHPILDVQSEVVTKVKQGYAAGSPFQLVWEGLGENARWFSVIKRPLAAVRREHPLVLNVVSSPSYKQVMQRFWTRDTAKVIARSFDDVRLHSWSQATLADVATASDLAVIPLPLDRAFERGKPESKLISFWRLGAPVVASSTPAYTRAMAAAGQALHCATDAEWRTTLLRMIDSRDERERAGRGGREFAEREYSDERLLAKWDRVFASV